MTAGGYMLLKYSQLRVIYRERPARGRVTQAGLDPFAQSF